MFTREETREMEHVTRVKKGTLCAIKMAAISMRPINIHFFACEVLGRVQQEEGHYIKLKQSWKNDFANSRKAMPRPASFSYL